MISNRRHRAPNAGRCASYVNGRKSATGQGVNAARAPETRSQSLLQFALQSLELDNGDLRLRSRRRSERSRSADHRRLLSISGERRPVRIADEGNCSVYANERFSGRFKRTVSLNDEVDTNKVEAHCCDGVLCISLPRREVVQPRRIAIQ
ncbi:Hsp20/alpha crystallin family protein [Pseudomonas sp. TSRC2-2]|uniref:Hsp20/alpha crystallin family protein n=1 Tax=Pseudomonas sp. TSRC2-2 TaxID=2804571 RepID=UPI003CF34087